MIRECQQMGHDQPASLADYLDWAGKDADRHLSRVTGGVHSPLNAEGLALRPGHPTTTTHLLVQARSPGDQPSPVLN